VHKPIQTLFEARKPTVASTKTAQLVRPYTKSSGKYFAPTQHHLSIFLAHLRGILLGDCEGLGGARVAITGVRAWCEGGAGFSNVRRTRSELLKYPDTIHVTTALFSYFSCMKHVRIFSKASIPVH
jgi:hypothetical protein